MSSREGQSPALPQGRGATRPCILFQDYCLTFCNSPLDMLVAGGDKNTGHIPYGQWPVFAVPTWRKEVSCEPNRRAQPHRQPQDFIWGKRHSGKVPGANKIAGIPSKRADLRCKDRPTQQMTNLPEGYLTAGCGRGSPPRTNREARDFTFDFSAGCWLITYGELVRSLGVWKQDTGEITQADPITCCGRGHREGEGKRLVWGIWLLRRIGSDA